jgi:hypothetical protein
MVWFDIAVELMASVERAADWGLGSNQLLLKSKKQ